MLEQGDGRGITRKRFLIAALALVAAPLTAYMVHYQSKVKIQEQQRADEVARQQTVAALAAEKRYLALSLPWNGESRIDPKYTRLLLLPPKAPELPTSLTLSLYPSRYRT